MAKVDYIYIKCFFLSVCYVYKICSKMSMSNSMCKTKIFHKMTKGEELLLIKLTTKPHIIIMIFKISITIVLLQIFFLKVNKKTFLFFFTNLWLLLCLLFTKEYCQKIISWNENMSLSHFNIWVQELGMRN